MALMTIASFGRKHVENATVVADTIYYAANMMNVASADQASYYRLLMTTGQGIHKEDVFQDFYMNGNLKAEGGYSFVDLGNDANTILNGEVTTYYINGKEGPKQISLSAGFGIPIINAYNNRSFLNISAQWVNNSADGFIKENAFRVNVGLTFNEKWFAKWKVE
jgi:hypothetical protein